MDMIFRGASLTDNAKLLELMEKTPQDGLVTISFERRPNYFYGANVSSKDRFVGVLTNGKNDDIVASSAVGKRPVYVNGRLRNVNYGNDVRIKKEFRGQGILERMFVEHRGMFVNDDDFCQLVILDNNVDSLNKIANNRHGLLSFYPFGNYRTHIISTAFDNAPEPKYAIRRASTNDIDLIQAFFNNEAPKKQFYPHYEFADIANDEYFRGALLNDYFLAFKDHKLVGVCGVWKQTDFKQTRIIQYPLWMKLIRPLYNAWSQLYGGFVVPKPGKIIEYSCLHTILTLHNNPDILSALMKQIRKELKSKGETTMLMGLMEDDPLINAVKGFRYRTMRSRHFLMSASKDPRDNLDPLRPVFLELARL